MEGLTDKEKRLFPVIHSCFLALLDLAQIARNPKKTDKKMLWTYVTVNSALFLKTFSTGRTFHRVHIHYATMATGHPAMRGMLIPVF